MKKLSMPKAVAEYGEFLLFLQIYLKKKSAKLFYGFEGVKDVIVDALYRRRGKYARPFVHTGMMGMMFSMATLGPLVISQRVFSSDLGQGTLPSAAVLGATTADTDYSVETQQGDKVKEYRGGETIEYVVQSGDTISSIADKFGISKDTILWANDMTKDSKLKVGQKLNILPVTGVMHTVKKGETVYSIAKKYGLDGDSGAQAVVDYPFNTFVDDEKFTLAVGQTLIVPDGVMPDIQPVDPTAAIARILTPDAGVVSATGQFVWPAAGVITQGYKFYHKGVDIANRAGGPILAADSGTVMVSGWPDNSGYGNRVMIDHGNGFITLYGHMSRLRVQVGQTVHRGDVIGDMGSTGRSTGTHLHFEIRHRGGGFENPLNYLR
jgi:murein DD-endopeptidase MepM/ murein hydrolase activator NlpD